MSSTRIFTFSVGSFSSPASGQVLLIGENTLADTAPSGWSSGGGWSNDVMNAYGGGAFCPDYGSQGGYVFAGTGGHVGAEVVDGVVFDFATETWSRLANTNGIANLPTSIYTVAQTNGDPWYEVQTPVASEVPAPSHNYCYCVGIGADLISVKGGAQTPDIVSKRGAHRFTTNRTNSTGTWERYSTNVAPAFLGPAVEGKALLDTTANRIWLCGQNVSDVAAQNYLDLSTLAWGSVSPTLKNPSTGSLQYGNFLLHDNGTERVLMSFYSDGTTGVVLDLNNISAGWVDVTLSGSVPVGFANTRWEQYPVDKCLYTRPGGGTGQNVYKITPPEDPTVEDATWQFSTLTPSSGSFPERGGWAATNKHYTCFFYVPARACFAWIANGTSDVALWKP